MNLDHIEGWNTFGDANDQLDSGVSGFQNGIGRERGRDENHRGVGASLLAGFADSIEDRQTLVRGSPFAWRDATHDVRSVGLALERVKRALAARDALHNQSRIVVN